MLNNLLRKCLFKVPNKQAVFTRCHIIEQNNPILYVKHDEDGDWQFLCGENHTTEDARIIAFQEIINIDPSVNKVSNIKCGQIAVRESKESEWKFL